MIVHIHTRVWSVFDNIPIHILSGWCALYTCSFVGLFYSYIKTAEQQILSLKIYQIFVKNLFCDSAFTCENNKPNLISSFSLIFIFLQNVINHLGKYRKHVNVFYWLVIVQSFLVYKGAGIFATYKWIHIHIYLYYALSQNMNNVCR